MRWLEVNATAGGNRKICGVAVSTVLVFMSLWVKNVVDGPEAHAEY